MKKDFTLELIALIALLLFFLSSCSLPNRCPQAYKSYNPKHKGSIHHYKPTAKKY
jgi:PBP1b-binding outer membrane lipoprotein LpoB